MPGAFILHHYLDRLPVDGQPLQNRTYAGWIFEAAGRCRGVRLRSGRHTRVAAYGLPRPDVATRHAGLPAALLSGFVLHPPATGLQAAVLDWQDEHGTWHEFWKATPVSGGPAESEPPQLSDELIPCLERDIRDQLRHAGLHTAWTHGAATLRDYTAEAEPLTVDDQVIRAHLDSPSGHIYSDPTLSFRGWIFSPRAAIRQLEVRIDPAGSAYVIHPTPRPDVAALHGPLGATVACGFSGIIRLPTSAKSFTLRLYATLVDGTIVPSLVRRLHRVDPAPTTGLLASRLLLAGLAAAGRYRPARWRSWLRTLLARPPLPPVPLPTRAPTSLPAARHAPPEKTPLFSLLVPVYNPAAHHLRAMILSVLAQDCPSWELCLADDASTLPHVRQILQEFAALDPRIRPVFRDTNGHIARATNSALETARGTFVALLDHDDLLAPGALGAVAAALARQPSARFLYTDRDKVDDLDRHHDVELRGGWNPAMGLTHNFVHHLTVIRRDLVTDAGGFDPAFPGCQDLALYLRCHELVAPGEIVHVPVLAYHWRCHSGSTASRGDQKPYMMDSARRTITAALARRGLAAEPFLPEFAEFFGLNLHQLRWRVDLRQQPVSVVVAAPASADTAAARTIAALFGTTPADSLQVIVVGPGAPSGGAVEHIVAPPDTGRAALFNLGAVRAQHPRLLLIEAGAVPLQSGWLEDLVGWLSMPGVAATGPKLVTPAGWLRSAGWTMDPDDGLPRPLFAGEAPAALGAQFLPHTARDSLLLDPACLLTNTETFRLAGGLAAENFPDTLPIADYCLRLHRQSDRLVFTPQALLQAPDAVPGASDAPEARAFRRLHTGRHDPYLRIPVIRQALAGPVGSPLEAGLFCRLHVETPAGGSTLPTARFALTGWCIPHAGVKISGLRVRTALGLTPVNYGYPRPDLPGAADPQALARHGFVVELTLPPGPAQLEIEVQANGAGWYLAASVPCLVPADQRPPTRVAPPLAAEAFAKILGHVLHEEPAHAMKRKALAADLARLTPWREGACYPAAPFHGHFDRPESIVRPRYGLVMISGWLFHESAEIRRVSASYDLAEDMPLQHAGDSAVLAVKFPRFPVASRSAVHGCVRAPKESLEPVTLRIWAELTDGSRHLVYLRRSLLRTPRGPAEDRSLLQVMTTGWMVRQTLGTGAPAWRESAALCLRWWWRHRPVSSPVPQPTWPAVSARARLCLVTHNLNREGAPLFLLDLARRCTEQWDLRLVVFSPTDGPLRAEFELLGAQVTVLDCLAVSHAATASEVRHSRMRARAALLAADPGLVIASTIETYWAVAALRDTGVPALWYVHEPGILGFHYLEATPAVHREAVRALTAAAGVSFPNRATQGYYESWVGEAARRIQPGWTNLPLRAANRGSVRQRLGLAPGELLVINVGTVCQRKGQLHFAEAVDLLWRTEPELAARSRFEIIGTATDVYSRQLATRLKDLGRANLIMTPATPQVQDYFAAADLFVLSSFEEGFPRVLLEAMVHGLPILATAIHGVPEIVHDGEEARLVPPGDIAAMTRGLAELLRDRAMAARLGTAARARATRYYTGDSVLPGHLATISGLLPGLTPRSPKIPSPAQVAPSPASGPADRDLQPSPGSPNRSAP